MTGGTWSNAHLVRYYGADSPLNYVLVGSGTSVIATNTWTNSQISGFVYPMQTSIVDACFDAPALTVSTGTRALDNTIWTSITTSYTLDAFDNVHGV